MLFLTGIKLKGEVQPDPMIFSVVGVIVGLLEQIIKAVSNLIADRSLPKIK